jgi:hypothetical protein
MANIRPLFATSRRLSYTVEFANATVELTAIRTKSLDSIRGLELS